MNVYMSQNIAGKKLLLTLEVLSQIWIFQQSSPFDVLHHILRVPEKAGPEKYGAI